MRLINNIMHTIHLARMGYTLKSLKQEMQEEEFLRVHGYTMQEAADAQVLALVNEHHTLKGVR